MKKKCKNDNIIFNPNIETRKVKEFQNLLSHFPPQYAEWILRYLMNESKNIQWEENRKNVHVDRPDYQVGDIQFFIGEEKNSDGSKSYRRFF